MTGEQPFARWLAPTLLLAMWAAVTSTFLFPLRQLPHLDLIDSRSAEWYLWHTTERVVGLSDPYYSPETFYPAGVELGSAGVPVGYTPLTATVRALMGADWRYALVSYKLITCLGFLALALACYGFLRRLRAPPFAAAAGAAGFAYSDYFFHVAVYPFHMALFWLPVLGILALRAWERPSAGRLTGLAAGYGATLYFTELFPHIGLAGLSWLGVTALTRAGRAALRERVAQTKVGSVLLAGVVFAALAAFPVIGFLRVEASFRPNDPRVWASNLAGFFVPRPDKTPLGGGLFGDLANRVTLGVGGEAIFLGYTFIALALVGVVRGGRVERGAAAIAALFALVSMGPSIQVLSTDTGIPTPFALLRGVPVIGHIRTPSRFAFVTMFGLAICAAAGARVLFERARARGVAVAAIVGALIFGGLALEGYREEPYLGPMADTAPVEAIGEGGVLNLPLELHDGTALFLQTIHGQPIATGYTSLTTPLQSEAMTFLADGLWHAPERLRAFSSEFGFRTVLISAPIPIALRERLPALGLEVVEWGDTGARTVAARFGDSEGQGLAPTAWLPTDSLPAAGRRMPLPEPMVPRQIDLLADGTAAFELAGFSEGRVVWERDVEALEMPGLRWFVVTPPDDTIDAIAVRAADRERPTALRGVLVGR
jgi:hypothetical protein